MHDPEPLLTDTDVPRLSEHIEDNPWAIVERATGKSKEEWDREYLKRRVEAIRSGQLHRGTLFAEIETVTGYLGLDPDDFVAAMHPFHRVWDRIQNRRYYMKRHAGLNEDQVKKKLSRYHERAVDQIMAYTLKSHVWAQLKILVAPQVENFYEKEDEA